MSLPSWLTQLHAGSSKAYKAAGLSLLIFAATPATAAVVDITAQFDPDSRNPNVNMFENTTPNTGLCKNYPAKCPKGSYSIRIPKITTERTMLAAGKSIGLRAPYAWKELEVTHTNGTKQIVKIRVTALAATYILGTKAVDFIKGDHSLLWQDGEWDNAPAGCTAIPLPGKSVGVYYFFWMFHSENECAKISKESVGALYFENIDFMYELQTPNPLKMSMGTYEGSISYSIGPNGDIKVGDAPANDSVVTLNFTLKVQHSLRVDLPINSTMQSLSPQGGWQQWLINGDNFRPQKLFANLPFQLSSSTRFKMQLQCQYTLGNDCGLQNDAGDKQVAVQTLTTLPAGVQDDNKNPVNRYLLTNKVESVFQPSRYVDNQRATLHFEVDKQGVEQMINNGGGRYRGNVTVIWDSAL